VKKVAAVTTGSALLLGLAIVSGGWWLWTGPGPAPVEDSAAGPAHGTVMVRIPTGMTLAAAADTLVAKGLLKRPWVLRVGARLTGRAHALRAGLFELPVTASPRDLLQALTSGSAVMVKVTIPEGLTSDQIAEIMGGELDFAAEDFLATADSLVMDEAQRGLLLRGTAHAVATHDSLLAAQSARHPRKFRWCEGHLAPDTFFFAEGTGPAQAAQSLLVRQPLPGSVSSTTE
jgi:cell division protein YceG involved in septum cleavage